MKINIFINLTNSKINQLKYYSISIIDLNFFYYKLFILLVVKILLFFLLIVYLFSRQDDS